MRCGSLACLAYLAGACTPPEPIAPSPATVEVTPPGAGMAPVEPGSNGSTVATPLGPSETAPPPEPTVPAVPAAGAASDPEPPQKQPSAAEVKDCAARGGKIEPVCMTQHLTCVVRYRDAGKRCTDKSNCQGECLYEGENPPPPKPAGRCQATSDPCGCKAPMVKGVVQPALCAD